MDSRKDIITDKLPGETLSSRNIGEALLAKCITCILPKLLLRVHIFELSLSRIQQSNVTCASSLVMYEYGNAA